MPAMATTLLLYFPLTDSRWWKIKRNMPSNTIYRGMKSQPTHPSFTIYIYCSLLLLHFHYKSYRYVYTCAYVESLILHHSLSLVVGCVIFDMSFQMGPENEARGEGAEKPYKLYDDGLEEATSLCQVGEHAVPDHLSSAFQFFTSTKLQSDMCPADDIIVSGKLIPLVSLVFPALHTIERQDARSQSLSALLKPTSCSTSIKARVVRSSRSHSLDDPRRSYSSFMPDLDRNCSGKSDGSPFGSAKMPKSRWQSLIFGIGMVKLPPGMELRDIKIRQSRLTNPGTLFPRTSRSNGGRVSSWGLIKVLSCKDHTSISVTKSFVCMPHI